MFPSAEVTSKPILSLLNVEGRLTELTAKKQAYANIGLEFWTMVMYGCESWTIKATDSKRLKAFEMDMYRKMMRISWMERRTNNSILEELQPTRCFLAEVKKKGCNTLAMQ